MTTLPPIFRANGFDFTLIKRNGDVALLSKCKPGHRLTHYEVVIVQHRKAVTFPNGKTTPAHEAMPSAEDWGTLGWSPYDLKAAHARFDSTAEAMALSRK
jgi:hypothetical protein